MRIEKLLPIVFSIALIALPMDSAFARIYKWVDDQGNIHFGERPPTGQKTEVIKTRKTHISDDQAKEQLESLTGKSEEGTANREVVEKDKKQEDEVVARRNQNCEIAQQNLKVLEGSGRVQTEDSEGKKFYLDDTAKQHKMELSRKQVAEFCG